MSDTLDTAGLQLFVEMEMEISHKAAVIRICDVHSLYEIEGSDEIIYDKPASL